MLSSFHNAVEAHVKTNYLGNPLIKPVIVDDYNRKMNSVDHSDHIAFHVRDSQVNQMVQEAHFAFGQYGHSQCIYPEQEVWHTKNVTFSLSGIHSKLPHNYIIGKCHLSKEETTYT